MCVRTQHSSEEAFRFFGKNFPILGRSLPVCSGVVPQTHFGKAFQTAASILKMRTVACVWHYESFVHADIDECVRGTHQCDMNGNCTDNIGSYDCVCRSGYEGDGFNCTGNVLYQYMLHCLQQYIVLEVSVSTQNSSVWHGCWASKRLLSIAHLIYYNIWHFPFCT